MNDYVLRTQFCATRADCIINHVAFVSCYHVKAVCFLGAGYIWYG